MEWCEAEERRIVGRFLVGVVVGVFLGVLVVAPNPFLSAQVRDFWAEARIWLAAAVTTAAEVAERANETDQQPEGEVAAE